MTIGGARTHALSPVLCYDGDRGLFLCDDKSLGFGFLCQPLTGADLRLENALRSTLESEWPGGAIAQVMLHASPNIAGTLGHFLQMRIGRGDPTLAAGIRSRAEFLGAKADQPFDEIAGQYLRDFQLYVTVKLPLSEQVPTTTDLNRAGELRNGLQQALSNVGVAPRPFNEDDFVTVLSVLLNRGPGASWRRTGRCHARDDQLLGAQVWDFDNGLAVDARGVDLGDVRLALLSVKAYPERVYFGQTAYLVGDLLSGSRGIRSPFFLAVNLHFPDAQAAKAKMASKRGWTANTAFGDAAKWMPAIYQRKKDFDVLFESLDNGHRIVEVSMTMGIYSPSVQESRSAVEAARTYLSEQSFTFNEDRFIALPLLLNILPFGADREVVKDLGRYRSVTTEHATRLLPVFADWKGSGTPAMTFSSRNGQLMSVDLFDSDSNYNTVIAAQSGSGKSFLANEIVYDYLSLDAQVWIIDVGGSYKKLCRDLKGSYLEFGPDDRLGLNPFPLVKSYAEDGDVLESLVATMAAPTERLSDFQRSELSRVMKEIFAEKAAAMTVDDIARRLREAGDKRVQDIGVQLYPFTADGAFGDYFAGANTVSLRGRLTVVELEHLRNRKHLQRVVLAMLIFQIQAEMFDGDRSRRKLVLIDEGWDLISDGEVGKFVEHGYRRFRKYGGAAILITQSIADLVQTEVGRAILDNSNNILLLAQKGESIDALVESKKLGVNPYVEKLLKSVHTVAGSYSEIMIRNGSRGEGVGRLVVSPFLRKLYSTKAEDVAALSRLEAQGLSLEEAINTLLERERAGKRVA